MQAGDSITIVIFGASGDLTRRKLIPALYSLYRKKRLPHDFRIVGYSRSSITDKEFRDRVQVAEERLECEPPDAGQWPEFAKRIYYHSGSFTDEGDFKIFDERLRGYERGNANRLHRDRFDHDHPVETDVDGVVELRPVRSEHGVQLTQTRGNDSRCEDLWLKSRRGLPEVGAAEHGEARCECRSLCFRMGSTCGDDA